MSEYIDKNALVKSFDETIKRAEIWRDDCRDLGTTTEYADRAIIDFNEARMRVKNFPTVDAVEVIRCKDCKYAEVADKEDSQDGYTCQFHRGSIWFSGSYCSWAERRTDEPEK